MKETFTAPDGTVYTYNSGLNNELQDVQIPGLGSITIPNYTWNRTQTMNFPGGTQRTYAYDSLMRIQSLTALDPSSTPLLDYTYTYDEVGNILTKVTEHGNYSYGYDAVSRLLSADNPVLDDEAYTYDNVGNRLTDSSVSGSWTYNFNNELLGYADVEYTYDENGNMTQKRVGAAAVNYIYDAANRLVKVEDDATQTVIAEYCYDPFGRRLWKDVGGTRTYFFYSEEGLIAEYDDSGTEIRSYGYKPDSTWTTDPLFQKVGSTYYWYQNDHLGTPQKLTAADGTIVWSAQYSAFGEAVVDVETVVNNLRMPGQYEDAETGLYYNYHRYYNPRIGRYLRVDPIGFAGGLNLFVYVTNNPPNFRDPGGLSSTECVKGLHECIVRKAKGYVGRTDIGDCADVALTALIECAAELKVPLSLPYQEAGKWKYYRSKDFKSTKKFAEFIRKMMGAVNLYDNRGPGKPRITKPRELEKLRPGDLILYDLRYHGQNYTGHTRILVEIDEDAWFWPYTVVEGHMGGGAVEESSYAMDGWILQGLADSWQGPVGGKGRTWDCRIFQ